MIVITHTSVGLDPSISSKHKNLLIMTKLLLILALAVTAVVCYDEKYDKIDVDKIIGDDERFDSYIECLLDKGPCSEENAEEFKKLLPEVIETACANCSPKQRQAVRKSVKALQEKRPTKFLEFSAKYDPKAQHAIKFAEFVLANE